ncbi:MAG: hypothetical protein NC203_07275 [Firmicutes bacterium]|nr:hypothetical protein [Bacillota bacterium]
MKVISIILLSLIGTVIMIFLCGTAIWSFTYLIRCCLLKKKAAQGNYKATKNRTIFAVIVAAVTLIAFACLLIFGLPFVIENIDFSEIPLPDDLPK